ncbi:MAG: hypothetical protein FWF98_05040 [Dehalococcoidia bacterium]|nr:hypothetical protein [Dehalococcoidia bacterium]
MPTTVEYEEEERIVPFGDGTIRFVNRTPILTPEERAKRKREIESRLFEVFVKYTDKKRLNAECAS